MASLVVSVSRCGCCFRAGDGWRGCCRSRGLGDVYRRQLCDSALCDSPLFGYAFRDSPLGDDALFGILL